MADTGSRPGPDGTQPLGPDASIEEIQARVAHLSGAGAGDAGESATETQTAASAEDPAPSPVEFGPLGASTGAVELAPATTGTSRRRGLRALVGGAGAVVIGLAIVAVKLGVKLAAVGVAAAALSGTFGDRYGQVPEAQRQAFEQRFEAAIGSSLDDLSDTERRVRLEDLVTRGASRLDDASLVLWGHLDERARAATDEATCAQIARGWFGKDADRATVSAAVSTSYDALSIEDLASVIDLDLKAIEAETAGSPAVRSMSDATMEPVFAALDATMSAADGATLDALSNGLTVSDAQACAALRNLDTAAGELSAAQYTAWAVWLATP